MNLPHERVLDGQKYQMVSSLIDGCPFLAIEADHDDVEVPAFLKSTEPGDLLILRIGRDPAVLGMPDLVLHDTGFEGTLSFQGQLHFVRVPWCRVQRVHIGAPFLGPLIAWPKLLNAEPEKQKAPQQGPSHLKLV